MSCSLILLKLLTLIAFVSIVLLQMNHRTVNFNNIGKVYDPRPSEWWKIGKSSKSIRKKLGENSTQKTRYKEHKRRVLNSKISSLIRKHPSKSASIPRNKNKARNSTVLIYNRINKSGSSTMTSKAFLLISQACSQPLLPDLISLHLLTSPYIYGLKCLGEIMDSLMSFFLSLCNLSVPYC